LIQKLLGNLPYLTNLELKLNKYIIKSAIPIKDRERAKSRLQAKTRSLLPTRIVKEVGYLGVRFFYVGLFKGDKEDKEFNCFKYFNIDHLE